jgi:hypothetical protein
MLQREQTSQNLTCVYEPLHLIEVSQIFHPNKHKIPYFHSILEHDMPLYAFVVPKKKTVMYDPRILCALVNYMEYSHQFMPIPTVLISTSKFLYDRFEICANFSS